MSETPANRISSDRPQLRADNAGFTYAGRSWSGFADVPSMPPQWRRLIAEWGKAFQPDALTEAQIELLHVAPPRDGIQMEILQAAARNIDQDVPRIIHSGLYGQLGSDAIERARRPWEVLGSDRTFPLSATEVATLADVTYKQVRDWHRDGLVPAHLVGGRAQFFSAAVLMASALRPLTRWQVAAVREALRGRPDAPWRTAMAWAQWDAGRQGGEPSHEKDATWADQVADLIAITSFSSEVSLSPKALLELCASRAIHEDSKAAEELRATLSEFTNHLLDEDVSEAVRSAVRGALAGAAPRPCPQSPVRSTLIVHRCDDEWVIEHESILGAGKDKGAILDISKEVARIVGGDVVVRDDNEASGVGVL